jgi:hypothetical protein
MIKNRKIVLSIFTALLLSTILVSGAGTMKICLREGETIAFSECNENMEDYVCEKDECQLCVNEVSNGVYCPEPPNACDDACVYLYNEEENSTITLISPEPDVTLEPGKTDFTFHLTFPERLKRCYLYINEEVERYTTNFPDDGKKTLRSGTLDEGTYEWRVKCEEKVAYGGETIISASRILNLGETQGSSNGTENYDILAVSPEDGQAYTGQQSVTFNYKISEEVLAEAEECTLNVDGSDTGSDSEPALEDSIAATIGVGNHMWKIKCGEYETEERSLIINSPPPAPANTGGGGGGGGGGGSYTPKPKSYAASKTQMADGFTKKMKEEDKVRFQIGEEEHTVTVLEVSESSVKVKVESEPVEVSLKAGQEEKFELTSDEYYDLMIKYDTIEKEKVNLTIQTIYEKIETEEEEEETMTETTEEQETTGITGASVGIVERINSNRIPIIIAAVIVVAVIAALIIGNKEQKK